MVRDFILIVVRKNKMVNVARGVIVVKYFILIVVKYNSVLRVVRDFI